MNFPDVLMKCGHSANATTGDGKPVCVICLGVNPGAETIDDSPPSLKDRIARCQTCGRETESNYSLPFFELRMDKETDSYYCGCRGWD